MTDVERSIDGVAKTIAGVLANQKYSIDYYQREYKVGAQADRRAGRRPHY